MSAIITTRGQKNNRTILHEVVPIDTPFLFGIFVGDVCNFKCKYCIQSANEGVPEKSALKRFFLEWDLFTKIVKQAKAFPNKIKTVLLSSIGEPLLNPRIARMLTYMNDMDLAENYEIVTNASMLTHDMTKALVDSGLTRLCISLQGVSSQKYKEICGYSMDYKEFYDNIVFFYNYSRGKCKLHIKTVDISLDEGEDELFYEMYGPYCDTIHIDDVQPVFKGIDYSQIVKNHDYIAEDVFKKYAYVCCSPIFYTLYTLADGSIAPCCDNPQPIIYGNVDDETLLEVWNGDKRKGFLMQHLEHRRTENAICAQCIAPLTREFEEDILDGYEDVIKNRL